MKSHSLGLGENARVAGKWIAGAIGLLVLLILSFATFRSSSVPVDTARVSPHTDDQMALLLLLTKVANDIEALRRSAETYLTSSSSIPVEKQPTAVFEGLPPAWERMNSRQFLEKFELGCRNFDGMHFENVDFSGMNLGYISFQESTFKSCSFERTIIAGQFNRAQLSKVRFDRSVFQIGNSFDDAFLENCSFDRTQVRQSVVTFRNARLRSTSFKKAMLFGSSFENATIDHGDFAGFVTYPTSYNQEVGTFSMSAIIDTDLSSLGTDPTGVLDFKSSFCGAKQLTRVSLAGVKLRLPLVPGDNTKVAWSNCFWGSARNLTVLISESDFRKVTISPSSDPWNRNLTLLTFKEYLSQIAIFDDKCQF